MKDILEYFGTGFLYLLAGAAALGIFASCVKAGGILNTVVLSYMDSICG